MTLEELGSLSYDKIMNVKFNSLKIDLFSSSIKTRIDTLYSELEKKGFIYKPHIWVSEEFFTPDDIPGFAIPFYLLHPKLTRLEKKEMFEAEGVNQTECLKILRHETGHAISHAYKVYRHKEWREVFGSYSRPYPLYYIPDPASKDYVVHLNAWYAQAHPVEDFAETFAVWLNPRSNWRKIYKGWGALKKLEYVDRLMNEIKKEHPVINSKETYGELHDLNYTIGKHYQKKKSFYSVEWANVYDNDLVKIFSHEKNGPPAEKFLKEIREELRETISCVLDFPTYTIDQLILNLTKRAKELKLYAGHDKEYNGRKLLVFITSQLINIIHSGYHKIPL